MVFLDSIYLRIKIFLLDFVFLIYICFRSPLVSLYPINRLYCIFLYIFVSLNFLYKFFVYPKFCIFLYFSFFVYFYKSFFVYFLYISNLLLFI